MNEEMLHMTDTLNCLADSEDGDAYLSMVNTILNLLWEINGNYKTMASFSRTMKCKDLVVEIRYK